jgi:hypothetical protein
MARPRVLLITNDPKPNRPPGIIDGLRVLVAEGALGGLWVVSAREGWEADPAAVHERVLSTLREHDADAVLIMSPAKFPGTRNRFEQLLHALGPRLLLIWEGDPWGRGKPITEQMGWWLARSDAVFCTSGRPQVDALIRTGARLVYHCPNGYDHIRFAEGETTSPQPHDENDADAIMIGGNLARVPVIGGLPGSTSRLLLGARLRRIPGRRVELYGLGWPRGWSNGRLAFAQQVRAIRASTLSVNWDHFPSYADYSSDRLPTSLIAGRVHVTTRHPGMQWTASNEQGLFQEWTPRAILRRVRELWASDPLEVARLGLEGHQWVRRRMSTREVARHMMSVVFDHITPPPADPWAKLPGPWRQA